MTTGRAPRIHLGPDPGPDWLRAAVVAGGGELVDATDAEAIVWADARNVGALADLLVDGDHIRWVQLPFAGIENFVGQLDRDRVWTCGKGVYAEPVAEMALALALAGLRNLGPYASAERWTAPAGRNLLEGNVTILGGGGITQSLVRLLQPWGCRITVVRSTAQPMDGVDVVLGPDRSTDALAGADLVVLALALTPATEAMIGRDQFALMEPHAWIVNVARGRHIVTGDLVDALVAGTIGGAGLDVTDPEPLPEGHPLWTLPNCIITPHVGNTPEMAVPLLARRVTDNVRRFARGEPLLGPVDVDAGY
jgi:phosphoglycerate dehydrogenase-like enzyme